MRIRLLVVFFVLVLAQWAGAHPGTGGCKATGWPAGAVTYDATCKATTQRSYSVSWKSPTSNDDIFVKVVAIPGGSITFINFYCMTSGTAAGSGVSVDVKWCNSTGGSCASTGGNSGTMSTSTPPQQSTVDTSFSPTTTADDTWLDFDITVTTSPDYLHCRLKYTY